MRIVIHDLEEYPLDSMFIHTRHDITSQRQDIIFIAGRSRCEARGLDAAGGQREDADLFFRIRGSPGTQQKHWNEMIPHAAPPSSRLFHETMNGIAPLIIRYASQRLSSA